MRCCRADVSALALTLVSRMPFTGRTFLDVRLPFGLSIDQQTDAAIGNIMLGAHHLVRVGRLGWLTVGGATGLSTLSGRTQDNDGYDPLGASRGCWDLQEFFPSILPVQGRLGIEGHAGPVIVRGELQPALFIPIGRNDEYELAVQHAAEIQLGHAIGGGVRVQGVALPTFENVDARHAAARNLYVLSIEPFLTMERKLAFLRTGLSLPIDEELGPPARTHLGLPPERGCPRGVSARPGGFRRAPARRSIPAAYAPRLRDASPMAWAIWPSSSAGGSCSDSTTTRRAPASSARSSNVCGARPCR